MTGVNVQNLTVSC